MIRASHVGHSDNSTHHCTHSLTHNRQAHVQSARDSHTQTFSTQPHITPVNCQLFGI